MLLFHIELVKASRSNQAQGAQTAVIYLTNSSDVVSTLKNVNYFDRYWLNIGYGIQTWLLSQLHRCVKCYQVLKVTVYTGVCLRTKIPWM